MVAASGDPLLAESAVATLISKLVPLADIITPNLHEAARMLEGEVARIRKSTCSAKPNS
jgi:hydroxymethylpyrimidine/phosphomethylpyrimidine kinase